MAEQGNAPASAPVQSAAPAQGDAAPVQTAPATAPAPTIVDTATAPVAAPAATQPAPTFGEPPVQAHPADQKNNLAPNLADDWRLNIPREIRDHKVWEKYHSPEQAYQGLVDAQELIGKKEIVQGLMRPAEGASQDEIAKYRAGLNELIGVPDSADRYKIPETAEGLRGVELLSQIAHQSGIGNEQFSNMTALLAEAQANKSAQHAQVIEGNMNALREEWGSSYEQNVQVANIGLEAFDETGALQEALKNSGMNQNPDMIKLFHELGAQFREGTLKSGDQQTLETLQEQITKLKKSDAYWEQGKDGGATRRKVDALMKQAGLRK